MTAQASTLGTMIAELRDSPIVPSAPVRCLSGFPSLPTRSAPARQRRARLQSRGGVAAREAVCFCFLHGRLARLGCPSALCTTI